jgi:hypothetical protein
MQIALGVTHNRFAVMHAGLVVNLGGLVVVQTGPLVKQSSPAALHQGTGVDPAEGAVLQGGTADSAKRTAEAPRRIVVMPDGKGEARDGIAVMQDQSVEMGHGSHSDNKPRRIAWHLRPGS